MNRFAVCDELQQKLNAFRPLAPETLHSLKAYYRVSLTYTSNALEGNSLTESETKVVIENGLTVQGKPLHDIYEAVGHAEAYDFLHNLVNASPVTTADILKLHELFYRHINLEKAGKFRTEQVFISGSHYALPPPEQVLYLTDKFVQFLSDQEGKHHPVEFAAEVHKKFVFIHPFVDGNGRVARLLMNLFLLRHGYPVTVIPPILRMEYIALLEAAHQNNADFPDFIAKCVIETQRELLRLLSGSR